MLSDDNAVLDSSGSLVGELVLGGGDDIVRIEGRAGTAPVADFTCATGGDATDVSALFSDLL